MEIAKMSKILKGEVIDEILFENIPYADFNDEEDLDISLGCKIIFASGKTLKINVTEFADFHLEK